MQYSTLCLVRHAQALHGGPERAERLCGGLCDIPLSPLGRRQVQALHHRLAREAPFSACYTSPLARTRATAEAVPAGSQVEVLDSLREIRCGELDGMALEEVEARHPELWRRNLEHPDDEFAWPGGETYREFRERCLNALSEIVRRHPGRRVLVFTHAGVISQVIGSLQGTRPGRWDLHRPANASVTEVLWNARSGVLVCFDDCRHLERLSPGAAA